jgi:hypothetical protein
MKSTRRCLATMLLCVGLAPAFAAAQEAQVVTQVVAQDLQKLRIPGKVSAVVWTRRDDTCTLQVVLQMPVEFQIASKIAAQRQRDGLSPAPPARPALPKVQAWLLRMDGTVIARKPGSPAFPAAVNASDGVPLEVRYSYPASAAQEAVAVAMMVDDVYYIEQVKPFGS